MAGQSSRTSPTVAVLMGGISAEREVSLSSGKACASALRDQGYKVVEVDAGPSLVQCLQSIDPYAVLNCLHGRWGEDGCVQGILEWVGIPYSHSGVLSSALAMDKQRSKNIYRSVKLPVVDSIIVPAIAAREKHLMKPPYVVKPNNEGSSVGVYVVHENSSGPPQLGLDMPELVMVEAYVEGRELTTTVMGNRPLGVTDIITDGWYDYDAKYNGKSKEQTPAQIDEMTANTIRTLSKEIYEVLGLKSIARIDFILVGTTPNVIEVNTIPGFSEASIVPQMLNIAGIDLKDFWKKVIEQELNS